MLSKAYEELMLVNHCHLRLFINLSEAFSATFFFYLWQSPLVFADHYSPHLSDLNASLLSYFLHVICFFSHLTRSSFKDVYMVKFFLDI